MWRLAHLFSLLSVIALIVFLTPRVESALRKSSRARVAQKAQRAKEAEAAAVETGENEIQSGHVLEKTIFSNTTRLLFVAGLEGTGHHAFNSMMYLCMHTRPKMCEASREVSLAMMQMNQVKNVVNGLFSGTELISDSAYLAFIENEMIALKERPGEHLFFLGLGFTIGAGMMSYPNFDGRFKSMDHPDIFALADLAEGVGLDFRVLVLQRAAADIVASTFRRGFGDGMQGKVLVDNAAALSTQLSMVHPDFYLCLRLSDVPFYTTQQNETLRDFLHPINMKHENLFHNMLAVIRPSASAPASATSAQLSVRPADIYQSTETYTVFLLESRLHLLDTICNANTQMRKRRWVAEG